MKTNYRIILGSSSPRRQQLLSGIDLPFTVDPVKELDENHLPPDILPEDIPLHLARSKSLSFHRSLEKDELLITADTLVFTRNKYARGKHNWSVLGKPASVNDARCMLDHLSGRCHKVITGVYLRSGSCPEKGSQSDKAPDQEIHTGFQDTTLVWFASLDEREIEYYINTYKPFDKAGSYGVQEWLGYIGIEKIQGSYFNVMGFPVHKLWQWLRHFNAISFL